MEGEHPQVPQPLFAGPAKSNLAATELKHLPFDITRRNNLICSIKVLILKGLLIFFVKPNLFHRGFKPVLATRGVRREDIEHNVRIV